MSSCIVPWEAARIPSSRGKTPVEAVRICIGPTAIRAIDIGVGGLIRSHACVTACGLDLLLEVLVEITQDALPVLVPQRNFIERLLELRGKTEIHQVFKALHQTFGHDIPDLLGVETSVFDSGVASILDRGNDRGVGRRTTDSHDFPVP